MAHRDLLIRKIVKRMRHDGCGGRAGKVELLTGIEGASSRSSCSRAETASRAFVAAGSGLTGFTVALSGAVGALGDLRIAFG